MLELFLTFFDLFLDGVDLMFFLKKKLKRVLTFMVLNGETHCPSNSEIPP